MRLMKQRQKPLNEASAGGHPKPFATLKNIPYLPQAYSLTGKSLEPGSDMTSQAFTQASVLFGQVAIYQTVIEKLIDIFNNAVKNDVLGDPNLLAKAEREINLQFIPTSIDLPMGRALYAFALIFNAYSSDSNAVVQIRNSWNGIYNSMKNAYGIQVVIPDGTPLEDCLRDAQAAINNLNLTADMMVQKYRGITEMAVNDGVLSDNPLYPVSMIVKWARKIKDQTVLFLSGGTSTQSSATSDMNATPSVRKAKASFRQTKYDPNAVEWEGTDPDGISFKVSFTDDWTQYNKKLSGGTESAGEGYLLFVSVDATLKNGDPIYASYVFNTEKDLNVRRFPRDYIGAIESILKEATKSSIFKVLDEYDFMRSWK